jgi:hypothetical protein
VQLRNDVVRIITALTKKNTQAEAQAQMANQSVHDITKIWDETARLLMKKLAGQNAASDRVTAQFDQHQEDKMFNENPAAFKAATLPQMLKASARADAILYGSGMSSSSSSSTAPQYASASSSSSSYHDTDPALLANLQAFNEVMSGASYVPSPVPAAYNPVPYQPRMMYASSKRTRAEPEQQTPAGAGAGGWYRNAGLLPSTVAIFNETQRASEVGFGDSLRRSDVEQTQQIRHRAPSALEIDQVSNSVGQ